jgi:hypothetical protein
MDTRDLLTAAITIAGFFLANFLAEDYRRFRTGSAIAAGIAGELESYVQPQVILIEALDTVDKSLRAGLRPKLEFRGEFEPPKDRIFDANVGSIGLLGPELAGRIAFVYGAISGSRSAYSAIHNHHASMSDPELSRRCAWTITTLHTAMNAAVPLIESLRLRARLGWARSAWRSLRY